MKGDLDYTRCMKTLFKNACINGEIVDIMTECGKITKIAENIDGDGVDLGGRKVYPGLVDVHAHGCIGYDTMDGDKLGEMAYYLAKNGTTTWLPTTMTMDMQTIKNVVNPPLPATCGANILGFHLEGPYISPKYKGAQNEAFIKNPNIEEFESLNNIKMVTVAPELDSSMEFIKKCKAVVSLGHTNADFECALEAIENGAACLTHTFNAMPPLHHRNPGPIGAAIDKQIYVQVICDGLHIHKSVIKMLYKTFGTDKMVLISDSMCATGLADGTYDFGGQPVNVKDSVARTMDGAIAGSTSTLFMCVKKAIEFGIPEGDAFKMASETPAKLIEAAGKGRIAEGCDADFIVINNNFDIEMTIINGEILK